MNASNYQGSASKEEIKKLLLDRLTTKGYPNVSSEVILSELKSMYQILETAGLMPLSYRQFEDIATFSYFTQEILG